MFGYKLSIFVWECRFKLFPSSFCKTHLIASGLVIEHKFNFFFDPHGFVVSNYRCNNSKQRRCIGIVDCRVRATAKILLEKIVRNNRGGSKKFCIPL